jgi:hypothetical protein
MGDRIARTFILPSFLTARQNARWSFCGGAPSTKRRLDGAAARMSLLANSPVVLQKPTLLPAPSAPDATASRGTSRGIKQGFSDPLIVARQFQRQLTCRTEQIVPTRGNRPLGEHLDPIACLFTADVSVDHDPLFLIVISAGKRQPDNYRIDFASICSREREVRKEVEASALRSPRLDVQVCYSRAHEFVQSAKNALNLLMDFNPNLVPDFRRSCRTHSSLQTLGRTTASSSTCVNE